MEKYNARKLFPIISNIDEIDPWIFSDAGEIFGGVHFCNNTKIVIWPNSSIFDSVKKDLLKELQYDSDTWTTKYNLDTNATNNTFVEISLSKLNLIPTKQFYNYVMTSDTNILFITIDKSPKQKMKFIPFFASEEYKLYANIQNKKIDFSQDHVNKNIGSVGLFVVTNPSTAKYVRVHIKSENDFIPPYTTIEPYKKTILKCMKVSELDVTPFAYDPIGPSMLVYGPYTWGLHTADMPSCKYVIGAFGKGMFVSVGGIQYRSLDKRILKMISPLVEFVEGHVEPNQFGSVDIFTNSKVQAIDINYVTDLTKIQEVLDHVAMGGVGVFCIHGNYWEFLSKSKWGPQTSRLGFAAFPEFPGKKGEQNEFGTLLDVTQYDFYNFYRREMTESFLKYSNLIWEHLYKWVFAQQHNSQRFRNWIKFIKLSPGPSKKISSDGRMSFYYDASFQTYKANSIAWEQTHDDAFRNKLVEMAYSQYTQPRTMTWSPSRSYVLDYMINGTGMWALPYSKHEFTLSTPATHDIKIYVSLQWDHAPGLGSRTHTRDRFQREIFVLPAGQTTVSFYNKNAGAVCFSGEHLLTPNDTITVTNVCPMVFFSTRMKSDKLDAMYTQLAHAKTHPEKYPEYMIFETDMLSHHCQVVALQGINPGDIKTVFSKYVSELYNIIKDYSWLSGFDENRNVHWFFQADTMLSNGWLHAGYPIGMYHAIQTDMWVIAENRHSWGYYHELGHNHQTSDWDILPHAQEESCNVYATYMTFRRAKEHNLLVEAGKQFSGIRTAYLEAMARYGKDASYHITKRTTDQSYRHFWSLLCLCFGWQVFREYQKSYRDKTAPVVGGTVDEKCSRMAVGLSKITNKNLGDFCRLWGFVVSATDYAICQTYPTWEVPAFFKDPSIDIIDMIEFKREGSNLK